MSIDEKEKILNEIFKDINIIDEKDKHAVIAYIRGTSDTRDRIKKELDHK